MNEIDAKELKSLIGKVNIIDLRDSYIYNLGHIPTSRNVPYNHQEFPQKPSSLSVVQLFDSVLVSVKGSVLFIL